jgi:hypothetical protein
MQGRSYRVQVWKVYMYIYVFPQKKKEKKRKEKGTLT